MSLAACGPSLGVFDSQDGYKKLYDSFGDIKGLYDGGSHSYDFEDSLLNEKTINEFEWEDDDDKVKKEEYVYLILPVEEELNIECIVLFFNTPYSQILEFSTFYFASEDEAPKKIKYLSSPDTEPEYDDDGNYIGEKEIEYDDPPRDVSLVNGSLSLSKDSWNSYTYGGFKQVGFDDRLLHVKKDGLIYIRIENNSGFNRDTMQPVDFTFINLMVRAVQKGEQRMFGLFDWIWDLLYGISKSMYTIIDNMLACANMLSGIEPITYAGTEMDFLSFLLRNKNITYAFIAAVLVSIVLVVIFSVFAIIRRIASEKIEKTPSQIFISVGKTLLIFIFIPVAMAVLIYFTNVLMQVLYQSTLGGSPDGLGRFLAGAFGQDARKGGVPTDFYLDQSFNYHSTSNVKNYLDLSDYDFFFSWIASIVIIICLGYALLMFIDRAISLVILFIFAPISLSTTVLDDGARFKLWRDQFITKFLIGYGCIIAINIYALIVIAITDNNLVFFENNLLNNMMKILIVVGGGVSMTKIMALVGNLISAGAGSNELRDTAIAAGGFRRALGGAARVATAPFRATRSAVNFARDVSNTGLSTTIGRNLGFKTDRDYGIENARLRAGGLGGGTGTANNKTNNLSSNNNNVRNAISGGQNPGGVGNKPNQNNNQGSNRNASQPGGNKMVSDSINNALRNNAGKGGKK